MERSIEATTLVDAPSEVIGTLFLTDPVAAVGSSAILTSGHVPGPVLRQEVELHLGSPTRRGDTVAIPIAWRATAHETLCPSFSGELSVEPSIAGTRLQLSGSYAVPLGAIGRFGDGVVGRRLARASLRAWLEQVATRLGGAAETERVHEIQLSELPSDLFIG